jgi:hypothetical protein
MSTAKRPIELALLALIVGLTLATAYIHFWVGGILLLLNAAGYATLAVLVVGSAVVFRRALPLVLAALAGYAGVTIVGWVIMGPYFDVAYLAKAIEVALIATIGVFVARSWVETRDALRWARSLVAGAMSAVRGN